MPARSPEELDNLFGAALNSGNLEALVALYEPQASISPQPGQVVTGAKAVREVLSGFVATKPTMTIKPKTLALAGDIALTTSKWELTGTGPDGEARVIELPNNRFYIGTLFVPQLSSTVEKPHELIVAYLKAALAFQSERLDRRDD